MLTRICIIALLLLVTSLAQAEQPDNAPLSMEGRIAYDKVIPVLLNAGVEDKTDTVRLHWIVFHKENRQVRADLRMVELSWPKGKWHVGVEILGKENKVLKSVESVLENAGFIISTPAYSEHDLRLDLGPSKDVESARRFRVTIRSADKDAKVNADITGAPSFHGYSTEGNRSIDVKVLNPDGTRASVDTTLWRKVGPDYVEQPLTAFHNLPVLWEFAGALWVPIHSYSGFTRIEDLGEGMYMVTALSDAGNRANDPTPAGFSGVIDLTGPNMERQVTIRLSGSSSLSVKITDAKTGKPLADEQILLFAPNGMPLAESSSGFSARANGEGTMRFGKLEPGLYRLEVGPRNWWYALHPESVKVVPVQVRLGENTITVPYTHPEPHR